MATNTNTSLKYQDIISKSDLIHSGPPAVYQLKPKKDHIGTLTRLTLGEKNQNKINKTILLVGETGTGKSTLITALINYAMGVEWKDDVWFQIVDDKKKPQTESERSDVTGTEDEEQNQSESQTSDVIVYEIFDYEGKTLPYSLTIIDTPGYGSTAGTEQDEIISQRLSDLFCSDDGVHEINAVGLVLKASENRLSDRQRYIFDSVVSLFGKDIEKNIVVLITHSDGVTPENVLQALEAANIKCAKDEENEPVHFMFNNRQSKQKTRKNKVPLKGAWDVTMDQIHEFTEFLQSSSPQKLETTVEVLNTRIRLKACIHNLQERIEFIELKQSEVQQTQEALKEHEQEMEDKEKFTVEVDEVYKVKEPVSEWRWWALGLNYGGAVCCTVCKENCHYPCTLAWYPEHCEVMKNKCTICRKKWCSSDHDNGNQCIFCEEKCPALHHEKGKLCTFCEGKCCVSDHEKGKQCPVCKDQYRESDHVKEPCCTVCTGKCPASDHVKDRRCTVCEDQCCVPNHEKGKQCPVCEGKFSESGHEKTMWKYVPKTRRVQMTKEDMKAMHEKGRAGCDTSTSLLETLKENREELQRDKDHYLEESFNHVVRLEQIALKADSLSTHVHLDFLIEKMTEKGEAEKVQKLEEMKHRMDEDQRAKAALRYAFGKLTAAAGKTLKTRMKK